MKAKKKKIAIMASGNGTNAERIFEYFKERHDCEVAILISNKSDAYVLERARNHNIPTLIINRESFYQTDEIIRFLDDQDICLIVLAGFLWLVPVPMIKAFPRRIINIHPALLPSYGGKGMYGMRVHEAVIESGDKESGITIHYVDEIYDHGESIFQARVKVSKKDTPSTLAQKIHELEYKHYPQVIDKVLEDC